MRGKRSNLLNNQRPFLFKDLPSKLVSPYMTGLLSDSDKTPHPTRWVVVT
jgi:hypothetical protein